MKAVGRRKAGAILTGVLAFWAPAHSGSEQTIDCRQGGATQLDMNVCASREAEAADRKLETLLAELTPRLEPEARRELQEVQAQWRALRDRDCKWEEGFFAGGSVAPAIHSSCVAQLTRQRIERLKVFLCEGAGSAGPCKASSKY